MWVYSNKALTFLTIISYLAINLAIHLLRGIRKWFFKDKIHFEEKCSVRSFLQYLVLWDLVTLGFYRFDLQLVENNLQLCHSYNFKNRK